MFLEKHDMADYGTKGVTFYLLFAVAGVIFCVVNAIINLLLFCNQGKGVLGSWLTWTILCAVGQVVWSFEKVLGSFHLV